MRVREQKPSSFMYTRCMAGHCLVSVGIFGKQWDEHRYFATEFHEVALSIISTEKSDVFAHISKRGMQSKPVLRCEEYRCPG